ncbi:thioester reductase domain-containing protein [Streptomyces sp. PTM05]|uniref:Carboxylic acid reductase n=1 Tax=Streptantibioticus parmotrematis TaxID=2873249 RepID=A0ABS7R0Q3_9ACTN|nr:carboxylic acid reductase [Streptantibioticus parmotrematis]MBY8889043.1 thioester reductase domain-containing protein [Streptantibioticus parmotrematis]
MSVVQTPADELSAATAQRSAHLYATDPQFRAAAPLDAVTEAIRRPGLPLADLVATVMEGYADRPALGERAREPVTDPDTGRTTLRLLGRYDTITYGELWERVGAVAAEWHHHPDGAVGPGDFVAILGPTSAEYTMVDLACVRTGAVSVPLQAGASAEQLAPIVAQSGPRLLAVDVAHLDVALHVAADAPSLGRILVLGHHPDVTAHQDALETARRQLAAQGRDITLDTLASAIERGRTLPPAPRSPEGPAADVDALSALIYTSGSTGTPKGAMYSQRLATRFWVDVVPDQETRPSIALNYMPLSHMVGRGVLFGTLAKGGIACFVASSDLSTLFEDLSLVRPTEFLMVPRICDMLFQRYQNELTRRTEAEGDAGGDAAERAGRVKEELRDRTLGGRLLWAANASAPLSAEMTAFAESCLRVRMFDGYGSTEAGIVLLDGRVLRPPVTDYKLADVPELGYFGTDSPHPRGELLVKSDRLVSGYFRRPDATAQVFDEDGFYRTGDIMAQVGPDELVYVDRRSHVIKLSQGEFVAVSRLEALFTGSPVIRQVFVYGSSARAYLLAVVVPTQDALDGVDGDAQRLRPVLHESLRRLATEAGLNSYEIPRDFLIETEPFSQENGLLSGMRKPLRPALTRRYGERLEALYAELTERESDELRALRQAGASRPVRETVLRCAGALLGHPQAEVEPGTRFLDLGGDSLSALSFSQLLKEIFHVDVPVGVVTHPVNTLQQVADHVEAALASSHRRPSADSVHGPNATRLRAGDLTLEAFFDTDTIAKNGTPAGPLPEARTVLLTGANGYLGRFLCLEWLERVAERGGTLVCVVRGTTDASARARLDAAFDSGDPELLRRYREVAADHLEVVAGDVGETDLGLGEETWQRLADTVDLIVHPAALVNHVLPYDQMFGPNVLGTAELIRLAVTSRLKQFTYLSTVAVVSGSGAAADEAADIRTACAERDLDGGFANGYASGYAAGKWAGEVLLREAHDTFGLPVAVFRSNLILAHPRYRGQLNLPDVFTRLVLSLLATGIAPGSFYGRGVGEGNGHYDALPVDFTAQAIASLGDDTREGYRTFNVVNPHDDGISLDTFVDWLVAAGHPLARVHDYDEWFDRFETALRGLPDRQKQHSLLPLLHAFTRPQELLPGPALPSDRFREAVRTAAPDKDGAIPHLSRALITKYAADLRSHHLL